MSYNFPFLTLFLPLTFYLYLNRFLHDFNWIPLLARGYTGQKYQKKPRRMWFHAPYGKIVFDRPPVLDILERGSFQANPSLGNRLNDLTRESIPSAVPSRFARTVPKASNFATFEGDTSLFDKFRFYLFLRRKK